jgi:putative spermidine/putrescine transport system ATP-binding protein
MLLEIRRIHREVGTTFIYVTHDQQEAIGMSHQLAIMNQGHIEQIGTPEEIYQKPATPFAARFIGETNLFEARIVESSGKKTVLDVLGIGQLTVAAVCSSKEQSKIHCSIRPEALHLLKSPSSHYQNQFSGKITQALYLGDHYKYWIQLPGPALIAKSSSSHIWKVGDEVTIHLNATDIHLIETA